MPSRSIYTDRVTRELCLADRSTKEQIDLPERFCLADRVTQIELPENCAWQIDLQRSRSIYQRDFCLADRVTQIELYRSSYQRDFCLADRVTQIELYRSSYTDRVTREIWPCRSNYADRSMSENVRISPELHEIITKTVPHLSYPQTRPIPCENNEAQSWNSPESQTKLPPCLPDETKRSQRQSSTVIMEKDLDTCTVPEINYKYPLHASFSDHPSLPKLSHCGSALFSLSFGNSPEFPYRWPSEYLAALVKSF